MMASGDILSNLMMLPTDVQMLEKGLNSSLESETSAHLLTSQVVVPSRTKISKALDLDNRFLAIGVRG